LIQSYRSKTLGGVLTKNMFHMNGLTRPEQRSIEDGMADDGI